MKHAKIVFISLLFLTLRLEVLAAQQPHFLSLKQTVQQALELSPSYIIAKNQMEAASLESKNAEAVFFPSLDLTASHGIRGLEPDTENLGTPWASGATLALTENFYDNGETAKKRRIADYRYELSKVQHEKIKAQIIRSVVLAYYRYNIAVQNLSFVNKNHQELERLSKLVSNQFYQGMKTKKDFLSFKTRAQRARLDVIQSELELTGAQSNLLALIGLQPDAQVTFDKNIKPQISQKPLTTDFEDSNLYEFKSLSLQQQISEVEVDLAKRRYWPELSLVGTASYGSENYIDTRNTWSDNEQSEWGIFLNLKFNLLDWGIRNRNIQIAKLTQTNAEQSLNSILLQAKQELEVFKQQVVQSEENYRLSKELQKMEEDTFKLLERDYKSGVATYLELTTGLANLLDAQARGLEADLNQADLYLKWKYYKGILNEETVFQ